MMLVDEKKQMTFEVPAKAPRGLVNDLNVDFEGMVPGGERQWDRGLIESAGDTCKFFLIPILDALLTPTRFRSILLPMSVLRKEPIPSFSSRRPGAQQL